MIRNSRIIDYAPNAAVADYNRAVEAQFLDAENVLHNVINTRFTKGKGASSRKFKYRPSLEFGEITGAKFRMPRHLMLREHGVGRGQKKGEGDSWSEETWWSDYWDSVGMRKLADVVAEHRGRIHAKAYADDLVKQIKVQR